MRCRCCTSHGIAVAGRCVSFSRNWPRHPFPESYRRNICPSRSTRSRSSSDSNGNGPKGTSAKRSRGLGSVTIAGSCIEHPATTSPCIGFETDMAIQWITGTLRTRKVWSDGLFTLTIHYRTESQRLEFIGILRNRNALPGVGCELLCEPLDLRYICSTDQGLAGAKPGTFPPGQNVGESTRARLVIEVGHR